MRDICHHGGEHILPPARVNSRPRSQSQFIPRTRSPWGHPFASSPDPEESLPSSPPTGFPSATTVSSLDTSLRDAPRNTPPARYAPYTTERRNTAAPTRSAPREETHVLYSHAVRSLLRNAQTAGNPTPPDTVNAPPAPSRLLNPNRPFRRYLLRRRWTLLMMHAPLLNHPSLLDPLPSHGT